MVLEAGAAKVALIRAARSSWTLRRRTDIPMMTETRPHGDQTSEKLPGMRGTIGGEIFLPSGAFIDPRGGNLEEVSRLAHRVVDQVLAHVASASQRAPLPLAFQLPIRASIPAAPVPEEEILAGLQALLDHASNNSSPDYMGHMAAFSTAISALGDFVAATLNNNIIGLELSPSLSLLEADLAREVGSAFGLPSTCGGALATGGSVSNLHALVVARNSKFGTLEHGLHRLSGRPVFFASQAAHASVKKAAMILGLGNEGLISVATNGSSQLDPADLAAKVRKARAAGDLPFCVVATAGTTVTGNIDPIREVAAFARSEGLWLHVDAAWGGGLLFSRYRERLDGIELADSITFCPQKLLLVALSSSITLFRDWRLMERWFRISFPYLKDEEGFVNRSEVGVQGSRPAEVLKLWLSLQHIGISAYGALIDAFVETAEYLAEKVRARSVLEVAGHPQSGIVCFRCKWVGLADGDADQMNRRLHELLLKEEGLYLSLVRYEGHDWLRAVFVNPFLRRDAIDRLFNRIDRFVEETEATPP